MDKIENYRSIIKSILSPLQLRRYANGNITNEAVFDDHANRYLMMSVGWEGKTRRVHGCLAHLDIIDGKIWIQRDGTEYGLAGDLEEAGVPKSDIVLAFYSEGTRRHTEYAVA